jgi:hypothetical protein
MQVRMESILTVPHASVFRSELVVINQSLSRVTTTVTVCSPESRVLIVPRLGVGTRVRAGNKDFVWKPPCRLTPTGYGRLV